MTDPEPVVMAAQKWAGERAGYPTSSDRNRMTSTRSTNRSRTAAGSPQRNGGSGESGRGGRYDASSYTMAAMPLVGVHAV